MRVFASNGKDLRLSSPDFSFIPFARHGMEYKEYVQEGYAFTELYNRQTEIMEEKRELDERRKGLLKRRNSRKLW